MKNRRSKGISLNKKIGTTLIAMSIIIFMLFLTLGRYEKNFFGNAKADIASAQTSIVEGSLDKDSVDEEESGSYTFSVKNTDASGNKVTEVSMKYTLTVDTVQVGSSNVTVNYELYKVTTDASGNEVETKITDWDATQGFTNNNYPTFQQGTAQADQYKLKFTPSNDGKFKFNVKVKSEQID